MSELLGAVGVQCGEYYESILIDTHLPVGWSGASGVKLSEEARNKTKTKQVPSNLD